MPVEVTAMSRPTVLLSALASAFLLSACDIEEIVQAASVKEEFRESRPLKAGGRLSVESFNGGIEVIGWDKDEVEIAGTKSAASEDLLAALKIDIVAAESFVQVRAVRPSGRRGNMGVSFVIHAPRKVTLDRIESSNGRVQINSIEGVARVRTSNGRVEASAVTGDIEATTSNGTIELNETQGSAVLRTSNGSIRADSVTGHFNAQTSNGSIKARLSGDAGGRPIEALTSNGSIELTLEREPGADLIATSSNGSITVVAPASLRASVKATSSNASVTSDFDVSGGTHRKNHLEGDVNGGGPRIDLSTSNAAIRLRKM
jgi:hypothetical protein